MGRARPAGDHAQRPARGAGGARQGRPVAGRPVRARHRQPARDHRAVGPPHRRARAQRDQLAGHADRSVVPGTRAPVRTDDVPREDRPAGDHVLLRPQDPVAARSNPGAARARRGRRGPVRDDRLVADLEPVRPPRHRRDQREPDAADEPPDARLGSGAARRDRRARRDASRDPRLLGGLRRGRAADRRRPRRLGARRPARGARRADLLQRRRRQMHVRDRQLLRAEHRRSPGDVQQRSADHARLTSSGRPNRRTRSRDRSRSPARSCSGSATTSG